MMIVWNDRSIRWFRNASEYTGYNKELVRILLEQIPCRSTLCDMGCGAALIDFELAKHIERITCVDISEEVICAVEQQVKEQKITNISTRCMDASKVTGEWETVIALFHGGGDVFENYFSLAKDRLILATHSSAKGGFGPENRKVDKSFGTESVQAYLDELGVAYHLHKFELEYGQPFTDLRDAEEFVQAYSMPLTKTELDSYLQEHLEQTNDSHFPYYLPKKKKIGLFVIRRDENEKF